MSNSVDNRVVELDFNTSKFEKGVRKVLDGIARLKQGLKFDDATQGMDNFENQADASFDKIGAGLDKLHKKFSTFSVAWMSIVNRVTTRAVDSFMNTINQIRTGGENRARNIEQASFMLEGMFSKAKNGAKMIEEIKKNAMDAVDSTAYGFDESAKAAAQFAASGVKAGKDMENTLKGIAGVAAMTSSSFSEVADIFTTAAGKGKVQADEFNRLAYKGLNARAELAKQLKITEEEVNELAKDGKISFRMFADAMADAYGEQAKKANETFDGALSNVKASLNRIGELWYTPHRENMRRTFVEEIGMFNKLKVVLKPIIGVFRRLDRLYSNFKIRTIHKITDALTAMGKVSERLYKKNAQKGLSRGIRYLLHPIKQVVVAAKRGFEQVFKLRDKLKDSLNIKALSKSTEGNHNRVLRAAGAIIKAIKSFREFAHTVRFSEQGMANLTDTFGGFAAVAHIIITIIGDIVKAFNPTGKTIGNFVDLLLAITGAIGRVLMSLDKFITKTALIRGVFKLLGFLIGGIIKGISKLAGFFSRVITKIKDFTTAKFDNFTDFIVSIEKVGEKIKTFFSVKVLDNLALFVKNIKELAKSGLDKFKIGDNVSKVIDWFKGLLKFDGVSTFSLEGVKKQFERFSPPVETAAKKLKGFIENLDAKGKIKTASNNLIEALKNIRKRGFGDFVKSLDIKGKAVSFGSMITGAFSSVMTFLKNVDYTAIGDSIAKGFGDFIEVLGKIKDGVIDFYKRHVAEKLGNFGKIIGDFFKNLPGKSEANSMGALDKMAGALGEFGSKAKKALEPLLKMTEGFGKKWHNTIRLIEDIFIGLIGAFLLYKQFKGLQELKNFSTFFKPVEAGLTKGADALTGFGTAMKSFGEALKNGFEFRIKRIDSASTNIIKIALALLVLVESVKILSTIDFDNLTTSMAAVGILLVGIIILSRILVAVFKNVDAEVFNTLAISITLLAVSVAILSGSIILLSKYINQNNMESAVGAMLAIFLGLSLILVVIRDALKDVNGKNIAAFFGLGLAFLAIGAAVKNISKALIDLASQENDLTQAAQAIFAIMLGLSAFTAASGYSKDLIKASIAMYAVSLAVEKLANTLLALSLYSSLINSDGVKAIIGIAAFLTVIAVIGTKSKDAWKSALLIGSIVGAIYGIIYSFVLLANILSSETKGIGKAIAVVAGIGLLLVALSAINTKGGMGLKSGGGIALIAAAILEISAAMYILTETLIGVGSYISVIVGIGIALGTLCGALFLFSQLANLKVSVTIILVASAILILAAALSVIVTLPIAALAIAILTLAISLGVFLGVMSLFSSVGIELVVVAAALALFGVAVALVGWGIKSLVLGLMNVIPLLMVFSKLPSDIITGGLAVMKTILDTIADSLFHLGGALALCGLGFIVAAAGVAAFGIAIAIVAVGVFGLAGAILTLTITIEWCANKVGADISAVAADVAGVLQGLFGWIVGGLTSLGEKWDNLKKTLTGGIKDTEKTLDEANKTANEKLGKNNKESGKKNTNEYAKGTEEAKDTVVAAQVGAMDPTEAMGKVKSLFKGGGKESIISDEGFLGGIDEGAASGSFDVNKLKDMVPIDDFSEELNLEGYDIGSMFPEEIQAGMNSGDVDVSNLLGDIQGDLSDTKGTKKAAKSQTDAYANMLSKAKSPKTAAKSMASDAAKAADKEKSGFKTSGTNAAKGYAEGIREYAAKVAEEAAEMVRKAKKAAKNAQGERSPAKLFIESGMFAALGYAVGIRRYSKESAYEAEEMVSNTYSTMRDAIIRAQRFANDEINVDPVIRPVVDLSNIEQGASQISSMFGSGPFGLSVPSAGIRLAENISADIQNGGKSDMAASINRLAKRLEIVTDTMNSRQMINNFQVDGTSDPEAFANAVSDRLKLKARAV